MQILNILQGYSSLEFLKELLGIHRVIESIKHMLAIRMDLGDPDFVDVTSDVAEMLSTTFADKVRQRIVDNTTFPPGYYFPKYVCLIWRCGFYRSQARSLAASGGHHSFLFWLLAAMASGGASWTTTAPATCAWWTATGTRWR